MKLGLALSGGGIKGAAHIGVLQALAEENINIDCISGTSSGSIIASLFAVGYSPSEILNIFKEYAKNINYFSSKNIFKLLSGLISKRKITITGFNNGKIIEEKVNELCNKKSINLIKDIKMPLIIPSVSLHDGTVYLFTSQNKLDRRSIKNNFIYKNDIPIGKCVRASASFPGIFEPVTIDNDQLIDGGTRENIPWKELKNLGANTTICVVFDVIETKEKQYQNFIDIVDRSINLMMHELELHELYKTDYVIRITLPKVSLLDYTKIDEFYNLGYKETKKVISNIKLFLNNKIT